MNYTIQLHSNVPQTKKETGSPLLIPEPLRQEGPSRAHRGECGLTNGEWPRAKGQGIPLAVNRTIACQADRNGRRGRNVMTMTTGATAFQSSTWFVMTVGCCKELLLYFPVVREDPGLVSSLPRDLALSVQDHDDVAEVVSSDNY
jgi:hypothetical protein